MYITVLNSAPKNGQNGKFYEMYILQLKIKIFLKRDHPWFCLCILSSVCVVPGIAAQILGSPSKERKKMGKTQIFGAAFESLC